MAKGRARAQRDIRIRTSNDEGAGTLITVLCLALVGAVIYFVADMVLR